MGRVGDGLHGFLETLGMQFVEYQRQADGEGKTEYQGQKAYDKCVLDDGPAPVAGKEAQEMLKTYPVAQPRTLAQLVIAERNLHAKHGFVLKQQVVHDDRDQQQI